jgi:hypothetical protein
MEMSTKLPGLQDEAGQDLGFGLGERGAHAVAGGGQGAAGGVQGGGEGDPVGI